MSIILTQTRPFNLDTTNAIPNGDVGYTKPVGLVYVTFFARSGEHEIFVFNDNQWVLHETLLQGEFKNIKMENISQFYVRCKVASGVIRISPKIDKSANTAIKQDLKYGKSLSETSNISQQRSGETSVLKAFGSDLSVDSDASVSVQVSETSVFPTINSVSLESLDSDVYVVTVNGENLTKDTQMYIYESQIDDSVAQSLSAGYLDENDSNIGEVVDLVSYNVFSEKPAAESFGSLEFIPEEGVVCVNTNQTFGNKNPIAFVSAYEMKIAMKGVLGITSYSVLAKDDNGSFLHKGSFSLNISQETEEISPAAAVSVTSPSLYWDGSSASSQVGSNTLSQVTIDNTDGKYEDGFFNFGTSGTKNPPIVATQVSLSTGIYTFSLWFKNKRAGSDFGSIIRQNGVGSSSANYAMGTHQTTNELGLHKGGATNTSPGYGFFSSGYDMSSFEGDSSWNHLAVVADGTNSTFYVNGQQAGNVVANVVTSHFKQLGGLDSNNTQIFAEGIDEVGYWDSALTAEQIATIYNSSDKLSVLAPPPEFTLFGDTTETDGIYCLDGNGDYLTYNREFRYISYTVIQTCLILTALLKKIRQF